MKRWTIAGTVFVGLALAGGSSTAEPLLASKTWVNTKSPPSLKSWRGKIVVVELCAAWAPPCKKSTPELSRLKAMYGGRGLEVVSLYHATERRALERSRKFVAKSGATHPIGIGAGFTRVTRAWNPSVVPTWHILDENGNELERIKGYKADKNEGEIAIKRALMRRTRAGLQRGWKPFRTPRAALRCAQKFFDRFVKTGRVSAWDLRQTVLYLDRGAPAPKATQRGDGARDRLIRRLASLVSYHVLVSTKGKRTAIRPGDLIFYRGETERFGAVFVTESFDAKGRTIAARWFHERDNKVHRTTHHKLFTDPVTGKSSGFFWLRPQHPALCSARLLP